MIVSLLWLGRIAFLFAVIYILFPLLVAYGVSIGGRGTTLFGVFLAANLFAVSLVYILTTLRIYEPASVFLSALAAAVLFRRYASRFRRVATTTRLLVNLYDVSESAYAARAALVRWKGVLQRTVVEFAYDCLRGARKHPIVWILIAATLTYSVALRVKYPLFHWAYGTVQSYTYLKWVQLAVQNRIFVDGSAPLGLPFVLSFFSSFSLTNPYYAVRFIGPFGGFLIAFSILWFVRQGSRDRLTAGAVALAIYVLGDQLPVLTSVQTSASPALYAMVFFLPSLYFLTEWLTHKRRIDFGLAAGSLTLAAFVDIQSLALLGLAYAVVLAVYWRDFANEKHSLQMVGGLSIAVAVGLLPLWIALLFGLMPVPFVPITAGISTNNPWLWLYVAGDVVTLYLGVRQLKKNSLVGRRTLSLATVGILFFGLYRFVPSGRIAWMQAPVTGAYLSVVIAAVLALGWDAVPWSVQHTRRFLPSVVAAVAFIPLLMTTSYRFPKLRQVQYDQAVQCYLQIKQHFPMKEWTIISPVDEYPMVLNYGWHADLWSFVQNISNPSVHNLSFPTNYVFLFVEKIPVGSKSPVDLQDAERPFPVRPGNVDRTGFYYRNVENRRILESKAFFWAEQYRRLHSDMTIYYDSPKLRVYLIRQDGQHPVNLAGTQ